MVHSAGTSRISRAQSGCALPAGKRAPSEKKLDSTESNLVGAIVQLLVVSFTASSSGPVARAEQPTGASRKKQEAADAELAIKKLEHDVAALAKEKAGHVTGATNLEKQYDWIKEESQ